MDTPLGKKSEGRALDADAKKFGINPQEFHRCRSGADPNALYPSIEVLRKFQVMNAKFPKYTQPPLKRKYKTETVYIEELNSEGRG